MGVRYDDIIFREAGTLNAALLYRGEHHRCRGKEVLPMPLHESWPRARQRSQSGREGV